MPSLPVSLGSETFLFSEQPYSLSNGVYILAWPSGDDHFPHYIGMTQGRLADRIATHLRNFL